MFAADYFVCMIHCTVIARCFSYRALISVARAVFPHKQGQLARLPRNELECFVVPTVRFLVAIKDSLELLAKLPVHVVDRLLLAADPIASSRWDNGIADHVQEPLSKRNGQTPDTVKDDHAGTNQRRQALEDGQIQPTKHFGRAKAVDGDHGDTVLQGQAQESLSNNGVLLVRAGALFRVSLKDFRDSSRDDTHTIPLGQGEIHGFFGSVAVYYLGERESRIEQQACTCVCTCMEM